MEQRVEAFRFLPFPYVPPESQEFGFPAPSAPERLPTPIPAAAEPPLPFLSEALLCHPYSHGRSMLPSDVQHPTDEDLLYAAMLLNAEEPELESSALDDGSMLHLADCTNFSDAERERSMTRQVCNAAGCTMLCRPRGRLCAKHQKQRERGRTPLELKDPNLVLRMGRPPAPFSRVNPVNKRKKLQRLDEIIDETAGGKDEGTALMRAYLDSAFWARRAGNNDAQRVFEFVGKALLREIPHGHPLRAQINALFSDKQLKEALLASEAGKPFMLPPTDEQEVPDQLL